MRRFSALGIVYFACIGCTHIQLQKNTLGQFQTVSALHQKQVLDNLAMFVHDPGALPYFNVLSTSLNEVDDTANAMGVLTLARVGTLNKFMVSQDATTIGGSRGYKENWSAGPVNDPRRLELMRCAYQKEVAAHMQESGGLCTACPDCELRWRNFYNGSDPGAPPPSDGRVTAACLGTHAPWFCWGSWKDVPKGGDCQMVGHYCGTYVWVLPGHQDELAKLTLAILDYAINQPPPVPTKQVVLYLSKDGEPATASTAARTITATIPTYIPSTSLLKGEIHVTETPEKRAVFLKDTWNITNPGLLPDVPRPIEPYQPPAQPLDLQLLNQRLQQYSPR